MISIKRAGRLAPGIVVGSCNRPLGRTLAVGTIDTAVDSPADKWADYRRGEVPD